MKSPDAPAAGRFVAESSWRAIDLLSDVHLRADRPATFATWRARMLGTDADAVLILGDLFEAWIGDDCAGSGFERSCVDVLRDASRQRVVAFLCGNRDFLVGDAMLADAGVVRLADPTLLEAWTHRALLTHGDALCLDDVHYLRFRAEVRDPAWAAAFLARPLAERRELARLMRDASVAHQAAAAAYADVDDGAAAAWLQAAGASVMVHGHTHRPGTHALPGGGTRQVLGDWAFEDGPPRARTLRLTPQGWSPRDPAP